MRRRILFTVEKNRVLVPVGQPCPFGCRYCYTRGGEVGLSRVNTTDILSHFQRFAEETPFETIQFGYDGDPFADPERGITMLRQLAMMGKNVNFSTKARLENSALAALCEIRSQMESTDTTLSALVSLSCWDSAAIVEPHTPSPYERIVTARNLKKIAIPVFIAVRPVLPHISDDEYERIADEGINAGCDGFILGPLYSDARGQFVRFIPPAALAAVRSKKSVVSWSAHSPTWTRYEDPDRLQKLLHMIERKGGRTFLSSADAVALAHQRQEVVA
ncbi:radical SAM protein [Ktedonosporobacter rubrisoli]|uniref:Radical SAM protein n=1 Tax=Ktedonosporobacter rubrisoli TaxID=2509675 RepID=A0A4V0YZ26_KTERU|nr:radical SAM protein [Ktedonosporobacter rubrisoli]QBD78251.1 radical SAM protein [Ktedonosporobacter rubrisoli]